MTTDGEQTAPIPNGEESMDPARRRNRLVLVAVGALILVGGGLFALSQFNGQDTSALVAVPDDAHMVFTMDLLQVGQSNRINQLVSTFAEPMAAAGHIDDAEIDLAENIANELEEELGVDLEADILSWLGRSIAVAVWLPENALEPTLLPGGGTAPEDPQVLAVVSVTDGSEAARFLTGLEDFNSTAPLEDGELYLFSDTDDGVVWLGGELMILASGEDVLSRSLGVREGGSILDLAAFDDVVSRLPGDRMVTGYVSAEFFGLVAEAAALSGQSAALPGVGDVLGLGFSVGLPDAGLRVDSVQLMAEGALMSAPSGEIELVAALPAGTVGFFAGVIPEGSIAEAVSGIRGLDPAGYDEAVRQMSIDLGVDIETDLLPSIGGEALLAVVPDTAGLIAVEGGLDIGILASLGLLDVGPMGDLLDAVEPMLSEGLGLTVLPGTPVQLIESGQVLAAYELRDDAFVLGSSAEVVAGFTEGGGGLADTDLYRELDRELPGPGLALYVDISLVLDLIDMSPEDRAIAEPVRGIGASSALEGNVLTSSMLILIDYRP